MSQVPEIAKGLNLPKHMAEHMYMFSGESVAVKVKTTENMMSELTDWFGTDFTVLGAGYGEIIARIICNENAMRYWALQHGSYVEVLEPESLRRQLSQDAREMARKYSYNNK